MGAFSLIVVINLLNRFVMRLAVLGATGTLGKCFACEALIAGHKVYAIDGKLSNLRDFKQWMPDNLFLKQVSIFDAGLLKTEFSEVDAVVSCIGASPTLPRGTVSLYSESIKAITDAMKASWKSRLVCMTSAGQHIDDQQNVGLRTKFFAKYVIGTLLADISRMESSIKENSDGLEYTIVRPTGLTNVPLIEKDPIVKEEVHYDSSLPSRIPRANVAKVMLEAVTESKWINKAIYLTMPAD